jgi:HlyD family secretion protein
MTCRAEIYTANAQDVVAVPVQAVFSTNQASAEVKPDSPAPEVEHYLFVERDGKVERRVVEVGLADDSWQEISTGLKAGERVVTGPYKILRHLKDGEAVEARERRDDPAANAAEAA